VTSDVCPCRSLITATAARIYTAPALMLNDDRTAELRRRKSPRAPDMLAPVKGEREE